MQVPDFHVAFALRHPRCYRVFLHLTSPFRHSQQQAEPWDAREGLGVAFWQWLPFRSSSVIPAVIRISVMGIGILELQFRAEKEF